METTETVWMHSMKSLSMAALASMILATGVMTAPAASAQGVEPMDTTALDTELDKYWKPQDRVPTRDMLFGKEDRHEFSVFAGVLPNDAFYSYVPVGARWNMYFSDQLGIEVFGAYWVALDGDLKTFLTDQGLYNILTEKPQQLQWNAAASVVFTPFHGKLAVFTTKLFHFDFNISLGVGALGSTIQRTPTETDSKVDFAGHLGLGLRFYATRTIAVRADYKQFLYGAEAGIAAPSEFTVGVSFWTN